MMTTNILNKTPVNSTNHVFLLSGSKGGVGKSLAAMALLDFLTRASDAAPLLIETDTSNPDVYKAYKNTVESELLCLDDLEGWLALLDRCEKHYGRPIVINQGARNNLAVAEFGGRLMEGLHALGIHLTTFWLINNQRDSVELLKQYTTTMPGTTVHVVRNEFFAPEALFDLYNTSNLRAEVESRGGRTLTLPALARRVTDELYGTNRQTIAAASAAGPFGNRIELQRWRRGIDAMFSDALV